MSGFAEGTPTATIELAGKKYELGFTLGAMKRAKELGVLNVDVMDTAELTLAMPEFVWACLNEADRNERSVAQIDELLNPRNIGPIMEAVAELFKSSMPKPDPNAKPAAAKKPTAGSRKSISTNSGRSASTT